MKWRYFVLSLVLLTLFTFACNTTPNCLGCPVLAVQRVEEVPDDKIVNPGEVAAQLELQTSADGAESECGEEPDNESPDFCTFALCWLDANYPDGIPTAVVGTPQEEEEEKRGRAFDYFQHLIGHCGYMMITENGFYKLRKLEEKPIGIVIPSDTLQPIAVVDEPEPDCEAFIRSLGIFGGSPNISRVTIIFGRTKDWTTLFGYSSIESVIEVAERCGLTVERKEGRITIHIPSP